MYSRPSGRVGIIRFGSKHHAQLLQRNRAMMLHITKPTGNNLSRYKDVGYGRCCYHTESTRL